MKARVIGVGVVAALAVLYAAWFFSTHDRVPGEEWVWPSGEARIRDLLAAERFAERMGWKVSEVRALPALDQVAAIGVLVVPARRQELHAGRIGEIIKWVERGGHLVVEAEVIGVADPLLDRLGVARTQGKGSEQPLSVEVRGRKLQVSMGDTMNLQAPAAAEQRLRVGSKIVSYRHGRGTVTAATSLRFARNPSYDDHLARLNKRPTPSIGGFDHAEFFHHLLTLAPGRELHVYFRPERLSLSRFLLEHAPAALASAGLLLALWLWSIAPRFGPVAPDAPAGRRRLLDHLRASGRYYWAKGLRARLVVAARDAALRRVARAQPDFAAAGQAERVARLSSLTGISKEEAARFTSAAGAMRGADFIKLAQHAQAVHSALDKGIKKEK